MDQYAESLARYPAAKFSYIGHNGTCPLAKRWNSIPAPGSKTLSLPAAWWGRDITGQIPECDATSLARLNL
jgi:hypothetical protein